MTTQLRTILRGYLWTQCLLIVLLVMSTAYAQEPPQAHLKEDRIELGRPLVLQAEGLEPLARYDLTVRGPNRETLEVTLSSDRQGKIEHRMSPNETGIWVVTLAGNNFTTNLGLVVSPLQQVTDPEERGFLSRRTPLGESGTEPARESTLELGQGTKNQAAEPSDKMLRELAFGWNGRVLNAMDGQDITWSLPFPATAGPAGPLLFDGQSLILGLGNSVLHLDPSNGTVTRRDILPGAITEIARQEDVILVTVTFERGFTEQFTLNSTGVIEIVRFGTDPLPFAWLRAEAKVSNITDRLTRDTSNPWLAIASMGKPELDRRDLLVQAIESATTFYDLARISRVANEVNELDLVDTAMDLALSDFATRGYDPRLLTNVELRELYAFPLMPLRASLETGDLASADTWARWVYRLATPGVPETREALMEYAANLRAAGRRDEAAMWQINARELGRPSLATGLDNIFLTLGRIGWLAAGAILVCMLTLHLTLLFKYWGPQTVVLRQSREEGRGANPLTRLLAIRYYSLKEKLVLILLFLVTFLLVILASWANRSDDLPSSLRSGTLSSASARLALEGPQFTGPRANFLEGYAAHVAGDLDAAKAGYETAGNFAPAINNLGVLTGSEALYQRASDLQPELREARYNLGRITSPLPFHEAYRPGQPLLAAPTAHDLLVGWTGGWNRTFIDGFMNPWKGLLNAQPDWGNRIIWMGLVVTFLLLAIVTVIWLVIPRPRLAQRAPYTALYHLLTIMVPGTGLAGKLWGILLLVPWAVFSLDLVSQIAGWKLNNIFSVHTDYVILGIIYFTNLVAVALEFVNYRRRLSELRQTDPDISRLFGLKPRS
jgi:hypothetical protein